MKIEFSVFVGILLSGWILIIFFLEYINDRKTTNFKKHTYLERRRCETCTGVYFISPSARYWRCSLCGSINKKNDNRNRDSSG
jgi:hypothetical protein